MLDAIVSPYKGHSTRRTWLPARLQWSALLAALLWVAGALLVSRELVLDRLNHSLQLSQNQLDSEASLIARVYDQNLHQAEQLSRTLSFDLSYRRVLRDSKEKNEIYSSLSIKDRREQIFNLDNATNTNRQFKTLVREIDANQVFMLDNKGYCVASGRSGEDNDCLGTRYDTRQYFVGAKAAGKGRQFAIGRVYPVPSFFFATAIIENGDFLGVLVLRVLTPNVVNFIKHDRSLTLVTAADGVVVASSEPETLFNHIGQAHSAVPDIANYRSVYKKNELSTIPLQQADSNPTDDFSLWLWRGQRQLLAKQTVQWGDFHIYRLANVESALARARSHWILSFAILLAGLLSILLVERSLNFSAQRKLHLAQVSKANLRLSEASKKLYEQTITDHLTGLFNRRYFNERFTKEFNRRRGGDGSDISETLAMLVVDIDKFKSINDRYGHPAGDKAIQTMADICKSSVRPSDVVARIGGEEFAILLLGVDRQGAQTIAERIRHTCANTEISFERSRFSQTCSIGLAHLKDKQTSDQLLSQADQALYQAKNAGRNRFVVSD